MRCIFGNKQCFLEVDTGYIKQFAVFCCEYCLFYTICSIFGESTQLIISIIQYFRGRILLNIFYTLYIWEVDTSYTKQYELFCGCWYCLYLAWRIIFVVLILVILRDRQYFCGVDTPFTKQYAVFSGDRYCLYKAIYSIFVRLILVILRNTQYFQGVDTAYTKQHAVFSCFRYCLYYAIRSIFWVMILFILSNRQYIRGGYTKRCAVFSAISSVFLRLVLVILSNSQYVVEVNTAYKTQYAVFSGSQHSS